MRQNRLKTDFSMYESITPTNIQNHKAKNESLDQRVIRDFQIKNAIAGVPTKLKESPYGEFIYKRKSLQNSNDNSANASLR